MQIILAGKEISRYALKIGADCSLAENRAAAELQRYLKKLTGKSLPIVTEGTESVIVFCVNEDDEYDDGFLVTAEDTGLRLESHNGRGIRYAVYAFLEYLGCRFFSQPFSFRGVERGDYMEAEERIPTEGEVRIEKNFRLERSPALYYRDAFTFAVTDEEWFVKFGLNAETWGLHRLGAESGGGHRFAGDSGHTFYRLLPQKEYYASHPEYYAETEGKRMKNPDGDPLHEPQPCLTNGELPGLVTEKLRGLLKSRGDAKFVSVSQNDNTLFCQCEACKKSYGKYGYFGTLLRFVNKVARALGREYPDVKIHTYAYGPTTDIDESVTAEDNVMVQFCPRPCHVHSLTDPRCRANAEIRKRLETLGKVCKNIFIYDYRSCLKYALLMLPDIHALRENMRCYAENHVKGIYSEMNIFSSMQPVMEELRAYLFSKLTWNPYMTEEEYEGHIDEFLEGFYGAGWRYVRKYLDYWESECAEAHVDSFHASQLDEAGEFLWDGTGKLIQAELFPKEKVREVTGKCLSLLDEAERRTDSRRRERVRILRAGVLWYKLFHTMKEVLEQGKEDEKAAAIEENRELCSLMRRYCMKYTTYIGMQPTTDMYRDFTLPPSEWNYRGPDAEDRSAFNKNLA